ncbi:hypothetical protein DPMN_092630 [Dreissena polymorpha]|uniref:Uncharacterized protein n=1 Tax=Dreissena polymorpha TaxID=45954 RepID=A0A9D4L1X8_DREPO|nr:hypothetical protein DPMN_092630 [Dreissena polymorpha]
MPSSSGRPRSQAETNGSHGSRERQSGNQASRARGGNCLGVPQRAYDAGIAPASTTLAPASTTQAPESRSISTSGYVGIGIGVFVLVLIAAAVIIIAYKKRRRQLHTEDPYSRYTLKADKCDVPADKENVPPPVPHRVQRKSRHLYLRLDGDVYDAIEDTVSSVLPPRPALPTPPGDKSSADNEYSVPYTGLSFAPKGHTGTT